MRRAWNHFSKRQIRDLFFGHFDILTLDEVSSVEVDGVRLFMIEKQIFVNGAIFDGKASGLILGQAFLLRPAPD